MLSGSEILMRSLEREGVETLFGYPGGAIIPVFDALYDHRERLHHILVRHEQAAAHAAQGYARSSGKTGVCLVTSGPGATNTITGVADAMIDSTPIVVIAGQVAAGFLGTDAFQEVDLVGITQPISKWSYQIRRAEDIAWAVSRAFYIARSGRPGPVILDFTKNAQTSEAEYEPVTVDFIRSYDPDPEIDYKQIAEAVALINEAKKPFALVGQGVELGNAQQELQQFIEKADIPCGCTMLGLSALPSTHPLNKGMLGMHGNLGPNIKTNECDVLIAIGMRFDDRVTGKLDTYAKQAKIIHLDIDPSEIGKNVPVSVPLLGDCKKTLALLTELIQAGKHTEWIDSFHSYEETEFNQVIKREVYPTEGPLNMGEVVHAVSEATHNDALLVTDVGQNQMMACRYFKFSRQRSIITSGGMAVKIILLNNNYLGNVRQWQALFYEHRYSFTPMMNPDYQQIASAYGIPSRRVMKREDLGEAIQEMLTTDGPFFLEACVVEEGNVLPMTLPGNSVNQMLLEC